MYPRRSYSLVLLGSRWVKSVREGQRGFHLMLRVMHCSRNCSNGIDQSTPMKPKGYERLTSQVAMSGPSPWRAAVGAVSLATRLFSRSNPTSRFLADRAKTRWEAPYSRAESEFSRFFLLCSARRPRNWGCASCAAEFSHGLLDLCTSEHVCKRVDLTRSPSRRRTAALCALRPSRVAASNDRSPPSRSFLQRLRRRPPRADSRPSRRPEWVRHPARSYRSAKGCSRLCLRRRPSRGPSY